MKRKKLMIDMLHHIKQILTIWIPTMWVTCNVVRKAPKKWTVKMPISFQVVDINEIYHIGKKIAIPGKNMV